MLTQDKGQGQNNISLTQKRQFLEKGIWNPLWKVKKFASEQAVKMDMPFEVKEFKGNTLTNEGINMMFTLICSSSGTLYDNANAVLVVGTNSSSNTEDASATESYFDSPVGGTMMSGYPTYGSSQQAVFKAEFDGTTANQAWEEFGTLNAAVAGSGTLLNYKLSSEGTKQSGQVWQLELTITLS